MPRHSDLNSAQRHTLGRLFQHPLASNLKWPQILSLLHALGQVTVESNNRYRVTVQGRTEVFRPPDRHGDVTPETIIKLRHLLRAPVGSDMPIAGTHLLAVHRPSLRHHLRLPGPAAAGHRAPP